MTHGLLQLVIRRFPEDLTFPSYVGTVLHIRIGDELSFQHQSRCIPVNCRKILKIPFSSVVSHCRFLQKKHSARYVVSDNKEVLEALGQDTETRPVHSMSGLLGKREMRDILLLSRAQKVVCYSVYGWGSNFSKVVSNAFQVPYSNHILMSWEDMPCVEYPDCQFSGGPAFSRTGERRIPACKRHSKKQ